MIITLAGRRVDSADAPSARFPLAKVGTVRQRLRELFMAQDATTLVCSAACGTDLLALEVAGELGIRRRIVLPFEAEQFRYTSVSDRPGDWVKVFDRVLREVGSEEVLVMPSRAKGQEAYLSANAAILDEAQAIAGSQDQVLAVIVWEGAPRGSDDVTAAFSQSARERGLAVQEILLR